MSIYDGTSSIDSKLSIHTSVFGLRLWIVIAVFSGICAVLFLFLICLCISSRRRSRRRPRPEPYPISKHSVDLTPVVSKEIQEIVAQEHPSIPEIQIELGKADHPLVFSNSQASCDSRCTSAGDSSSLCGGGGSVVPEVSHFGWGRWYSVQELEIATDGFSDSNVIGEGGYGIVCHGILGDGTSVAVKNLMNNKGQAEKEFKVEVEAIGRVRHKNLVRLLGYCVEGAHRMLVYEYVDHGNLEQWIHGISDDISPLTWSIRMNIILGTAKGLAYLHEGLEPKVVHRDVKAGNILLDRQWNPKVSDFGLAKLLCDERSYVTTRVMGTFGYVAPEYACTGMLNEKSDIYSFGILMMEIITGRYPVDYSKPSTEVNLVEWLKAMVGDRRSEAVVDPKIHVLPPSKALKRAILVALRCVDPDAQKRPKMGHIVHMLEATDDLLLRDSRDRRAEKGREEAGITSFSTVGGSREGERG